MKKKDLVFAAVCGLLVSSPISLHCKFEVLTEVPTVIAEDEEEDDEEADDEEFDEGEEEEEDEEADVSNNF